MGEHNQATVTLVRNWCAHARIEKFGGVGIVEQMTGYPIGPHGVICDYAPAGGMYSPDLAMAALDFHDRHCVGCQHPKACRLSESQPAPRRARRRHQVGCTEREQAATLAYEDTRAARRAVRVALRAQVDAVSATTVDQIAALDGEGDSTTAAALIASARLAPEAFPVPIIAYLFEVSEAQEGWAIDAALQILLRSWK